MKMTKTQYKKYRPSALRADMAYQREPDENRVRRIAENFDPELFGVPVLSMRADDSLYVVDGWHRISALVMVGDDALVQCEVHRGLTVGDEARMFHRLQKERRGHTQFGQFKARLCFGEPAAVEIRRIAGRHGLKICTNKSTKTITAVASAERSHKAGVLDEVLTTIIAWDTQDAAALDGFIINCLTDFFRTYEAEPQYVAKKLDKYSSPSRLTKQIKRRVKDYARPRALAAQDELLRLHNYRAPKTRKLDLLHE